MPEFPGLKDITPAQQDALDYMVRLRGDVIVQISRHTATDSLIWLDAERVAVIDTDGNFRDPETAPPDSPIVLRHEDYITGLNRERNARNN